MRESVRLKADCALLFLAPPELRSVTQKWLPCGAVRCGNAAGLLRVGVRHDNCGQGVGVLFDAALVVDLVTQVQARATQMTDPHADLQRGPLLRDGAQVFDCEAGNQRRGLRSGCGIKSRGGGAVRSRGSPESMEPGFLQNP